MSVFRCIDMKDSTFNTWYELIVFKANHDSIMGSPIFRELAVTTVRLDNLAKNNPTVHHGNRTDNSLLFIIILFLILAWWWQGGYGYGNYMGYPAYGGYGGYGFYNGY